MTDENTTYTSGNSNSFITSQYASLYLKDPDLVSWAGLAAYVSNQVGLLIQLEERFKLDSIPQFRIGKKSFSADILSDLSVLKEGNQAIFRDVFWALDLLLKDKAKLKRKLKESNHDNLFLQAFDCFLNNGGCDSSITKANLLLTEHEQHNVIQPYFSKLSKKGKKLISLFTHLDFDTEPEKIKLKHLTSFYFHFLTRHPCMFIRNKGADISNLDFRWEWIMHSLYPRWEKHHKKRESVLANMSVFSVLKD